MTCGKQNSPKYKSRKHSEVKNGKQKILGGLFMKRSIVVLITVVLMIGVFSACSFDNDLNQSTGTFVNNDEAQNEVEEFKNLHPTKLSKEEIEEILRKLEPRTNQAPLSKKDFMELQKSVDFEDFAKELSARGAYNRNDLKWWFNWGYYGVDIYASNTNVKKILKATGHLGDGITLAGVALLCVPEGFSKVPGAVLTAIGGVLGVQKYLWKRCKNYLTFRRTRSSQTNGLGSKITIIIVDNKESWLFNRQLFLFGEILRFSSI